MRILWLTCLLFLAACAAPQNTNDIKNSDFKAAEPPPKMSIGEKPAAPPQNVAVEEKPTDIKPVNKPGEVNVSCKTDSDCKIKDVGSCCGYRPACVNKNSETFPAQVKAQCDKEGKMGICGFPSISSCTCTNNKCEGVAGEMSEGKVQ